MSRVQASTKTKTGADGGTTLEQRFGACPFATAQRLISGKWAILVLHYLQDGPLRFNELLRLMPQMTHATLSSQLKTLVGYGLMERRQHEAIPPRVEYSLTPAGLDFAPVLEAISDFGVRYIKRVESGEIKAKN